LLQDAIIVSFFSIIIENLSQLLPSYVPTHDHGCSNRDVLEVDKAVNKAIPEITPYNYFENINLYHGFDKISKKAWVANVVKLLICYQKLTSIIQATKLPLHKKSL
jgi:hypothetical protein